ncbi:PREDICTED: LOW QUALITY PROTEIN: bcl-2-associated transcription factor 1 [Galeopterus variegatus]|uniref:LOW QUALITY PROTEIN: bcl-2-associated transcription factor 1 n=1 Tax=Galeopterus variegatus TaxID=482537 RepID=A0ABM0S0L0_GALVR|nr:PREDICTED: LOW QUALITY PROTEIN: bcl-2-associated transcription factor 1 [Galeopterus variegatus]
MSLLPGRPFSPPFLGHGGHRGATWPGGQGFARAGLALGLLGESTRFVHPAGESRAGLVPGWPRCARAASRGRQRDRSGPRSIPSSLSPAAPSRADPPSPRSPSPAGTMASPSGSPEDTGKLRGRDGRPRREEDDAPPEEKRLRLGLEAGIAETEEAEDAPRLGTEDTGTQTGGEGRGGIIFRSLKGTVGDQKLSLAGPRKVLVSVLLHQGISNPSLDLDLK